MKLLEGFNYHDLVGQVTPIVSVDEYSAKAGTDDEIVTLSFIVKGQQASKDLVDWFERGYEWILDAQVSDGEYSLGKNLVFVEMPRRTTVPARIIELLNDLDTLTDIPLNEWTIKINDEDYDPDLAQLKNVLELSPHQYRVDNEMELNEMREMAGITTVNVNAKPDSLLKDFLSKAGL
jgi:hypothetical protein